MGRPPVIQPNGQLAIFSTISDDFTWTNMSEVDFLGVCIAFEGIGLENALKSLQAVKNRDIRLSGEPFLFDDAIQTIHNVHGKRKAEATRKRLSKPTALENYGLEISVRDKTEKPPLPDVKTAKLLKLVNLIATATPFFSETVVNDITWSDAFDALETVLSEVTAEIGND